MKKHLMDMTLAEIAAEAKRNVFAFFDGDTKELVFPEDSTACPRCRENGESRMLKEEYFDDPDKTRMYLACARCGYVVEQDPISEIDDDSDGGPYYV